MKKFEAVAVRLNSNPRFKPVLKGLTIFERFKAWMKSFVQMRNEDEAACRVAFKYSECERLLKEIKSRMDEVTEPKRV